MQCSNSERAQQEIIFLTTFWDCQNENYYRENTFLNCHERSFHFTKILTYAFLISQSISFTISIALVQFPWAKFTMHFYFSLAKFTVLFQDLYAWKQCNAMLKFITRNARNNFFNYFLRLPKWRISQRECLPKLSCA